MPSKEFALLGREEVRKKDKLFWFGFLFLVFITYWVFTLPVSMMIGFACVVATMITFLLYFALRNSKPTHIKIEGLSVSARRYKRPLWSTKISELGYEATLCNDELKRTFYVYRNGVLGAKFSFLPSEMFQYQSFLESVADILKKDRQLFYSDTHAKEIPIRALTSSTIVESDPKSSKQQSGIYLFFLSLFKLIVFTNPDKESFGCRKNSVRIMRGIFFISILFGLVQGWYTLLYSRPFVITPYLATENYIVDDGILSEIRKRKQPAYLELTRYDGKQIKLDTSGVGSAIQEHAVAKVWWFPLKGSDLGWIAKMEINGHEVASIKEQQNTYKKNIEDYYRELQSIVFFLGVSFLVWMWEFGIRYRINRTLSS